MADEEHVRVFQQGNRAWNEWKIRNPMPDLRGANLSQNKKGYTDDFWGGPPINLSGTILDGAQMDDMVFAGADFSYASLIGANLRGSIFTNCRFIRQTSAWLIYLGQILIMLILLEQILQGQRCAMHR